MTHRVVRPDRKVMLEHIEFVFGDWLDGHHEGLIELAWTDSEPPYALRHARLFGTDEFEELVDEACRRNAVPTCNVYIGAALRRPDTAPFGRASDSDAWCLTCLYADLDEEGAAASAEEI